MTIFKVNPGDLSNFTVETEPKVEIKKVEDTKITLFGRRNFVSHPTDKDKRKSGEKKAPSEFTSDYLTSFIGLNKLKDSLLDIPPLEVSPKRLSGNKILTETEVSIRKPGNQNKLLPYYDEILQKKWMIQDLLNPFYGFSDDWNYEDFHYLNFFDWVDPSNANQDPIALLYPNISERYDITDNVTIKFWIRAKEFRDPPGTIIHIPNCLAVFLLGDAPSNSFGLKVQFHSSSNNDPDDTTLPFENLEIFSNCISYNKWNYVELTLKKGSKVSLKVNSSNFEGNNFVIISEIFYADYGIISIGSFCSGDNTLSNHKILFNSRAAQTRGVTTFGDIHPDDQGKERPTNFNLSNQLVAQIHELKITVDNFEIFYLKPSFYNKTITLKRNFNVGGIQGFDRKTGVVRTTSTFENFHTINGKLSTPINTLVSFGSGGHLINFENFLFDKSIAIGYQNTLPRIFGFDPPEITRSGNEQKTCDEIIFDNTQLSKRNLFIMPCDNGDIFFDLKLNPISLENLKSTEVKPINFENSIDVLKDSYGSVPFLGKFFDKTPLIEACSNSIVDPPTVLDKITADSSSNQYVLFEIPNLFFGKRIKPGTFSIKATVDKVGHFSFTLQDDGQGGLYPLNPNGNSAKWNIVGRVYYNEGLVLIKNPHLYFFGHKDDWEMSFKGEQNVYTLKIEAIANQSSLNYSRNKTFDESLSPSALPDDEDDDFVFISNINFHDKDLNVIAKTQLAQPFLKKTGDSVLFKVQMDF
jgi:hypothetical protein